MAELKKILSENKVFLIPYFLIVVISSYFLLHSNKIDIHIFINKHYTFFFDYFFKYITYLGDGLVLLFLGFVLLFIKYRWAIISFLSSIFLLIIIQFLKRIIFSTTDRPKFIFKYFYEGTYKLHIISGTDPGINNSFPSGHATSTFAMFFMLSLFIKNKYLKFIFFVLASLTAFSRVYLSWHFLEDIVAGSLIGVSVSLIIYWLINKSKKSFLDKSILNRK